ncbi:MAG: triose-phosphate isomerase [Oscillospiraceae bacterium]|jgi:triosephosphate isomerase|nr:triose-phosphate isomerase [Oscillospiraceae bacterium]
MNKATRRAVIAGNWKMNKTREGTRSLIEEITAITANVDESLDVIVCVPYTNLETAIDAVKGTRLKVAAQNVHWAESGAFTGEVSAAMLKDLGVNYVIIGHSERRQFFGENDSTVNLRVLAALEAKLTPILCVGELLEERSDDITAEVLSTQLKLGLKEVTAEQITGVIIAYEPVWAIGTGETATAEQADETCGVIRVILGKLFGEDIAEQVTIQYGGSMNAKNAKELLEKTNVDGGLIGGASLKGADFVSIIRTADDLI